MVSGVQTVILQVCDCPHKSILLRQLACNMDELGKKRFLLPALFELTVENTQGHCQMNEVRFLYHYETKVTNQ